MPEIRLPRLVGGRERATQYLDRVREEIRGEEVVVDCIELRSGSPSFADQLVLETIGEGGARSLALKGAPPKFYEYVRESAVAMHAASRLQQVERAGA